MINRIRKVLTYMLSKLGLYKDLNKQTPVKKETHKEWSRRLAQELVDNLNRNVMKEDAENK